MALNDSGEWKIRNFQPISRRISETVQDRTKVTISFVTSQHWLYAHIFRLIHSFHLHI